MKNTGDISGEEIVQLYIQDLYGSNVRPVKELKKFEKVKLNPGQSKEIVFRISTDDLFFYTNEGEYVVEEGMFKVFIGPNSKKVHEKTFEFIFSE